MITNEVKFLLTHSSIYGLGTIVSRLVAFVLLPLYTRYLTPEDYGVLEAIDVTTAMIGLVVTIGIARALSRFYYSAKEKSEQDGIVSTTYIIYTAIAIFFAPILLLLSGWFGELLFQSSMYGFYLKISFITLLMGGLVDIAMMYLRLIKQPLVYISLTLVRLFLLIMLNIVFIVYYKMGLVGILYSSLIVRTCYAIILTTTILKNVSIRFSKKIAVELLKYGLPIIPSGIANTAVKQSDKYFVLYLMSVSDMGIYSLALKLGNAIHSLLTIPFNMVYIPRRFELMKEKEAAETYKRIFTYYVFSVGYFVLILSVMIPEILKVLVTEEFRGAGNIIPLVALSMVILGCHYHLDFGILYSKKTKYLSYINLVCAGLNIGLNYSLITMFGLYGAVWSAISILGLQALLLLYYSQKFFPIEYEFKRIFKYFIVALVIYSLSHNIQITHNIILIVFVKGVFLTIIFPIAVIVLRIVENEELKKIISIIANRMKSFRKKRVCSKIG